MRPEATDRHYVAVSRLATGFWGLFASVVAIYSVELGSLIEVVNRFGSYFYGTILGVFLLAIGWPRANGNGAFVGLIAGMTAVGYIETFTDIEFLWLNVVGAVAVFVVGVMVSACCRCAAHEPRRDRRGAERRSVIMGRPLLFVLLLVIAADGRVVGAGRVSPAEEEMTVASHDAVEILFPDDKFHGMSLVLGDAGQVIRIVVAYGVERRLRVLVGNAQQEHATEPRLLWPGGEERAVVLQLPQVGAMRVLHREDVFDRPAIAHNGNGIHDGELYDVPSSSAAARSTSNTMRSRGACSSRTLTCPRCCAWGGHGSKCRSAP